MHKDTIVIGNLRKETDVLFGGVSSGVGITMPHLGDDVAKGGFGGGHFSIHDGWEG